MSGVAPAGLLRAVQQKRVAGRRLCCARALCVAIAMLELLLASPERLQHWLGALLINGLLIAIAQRLPLLTPAGWVHAGILGTLLLGSLDWPGWWAVVLYLAFGSLVTRLGFRRKQDLGLAEDVVGGAGLGMSGDQPPPVRFWRCCAYRASCRQLPFRC